MHNHILSTATGSHSLPNELVDMFIKNLDGDSQALASLGRTCSAFQKLIKDGSLLYRKIAVGKNPKSNDMMWLIRTLMEHPEYAAEIEELSVIAPLDPPNNASSSRGPPPAGRYPFKLHRGTARGQYRSLMQSIVDRIKTFGDPDDEAFMFFTHHWISSILNRERTTYTPLLLGLCPNV